MSAANSAASSAAFPAESKVPRSFVDYQLARSAQTRHALGTLHADAQLLAGTDQSRHFTRAPAQPTPWSSGQSTVLPFREADTRRDYAARNVQRIYRGHRTRTEQRTYYEMAKEALRIQKLEADEFSEQMAAVGRARKARDAASVQIQSVRRGVRARREMAALGQAGLLEALRKESAERDEATADMELDPQIAKARALRRAAEASVQEHQGELQALADAPLVTAEDQAAAAAAVEARDKAMYLGAADVAPGLAPAASSKAPAPAPAPPAPLAPAPAPPPQPALPEASKEVARFTPSNTGERRPTIEQQLQVAAKAPAASPAKALIAILLNVGFR